MLFFCANTVPCRPAAFWRHPLRPTQAVGKFFHRQGAAAHDFLPGDREHFLNADLDRR